ncbi:hypothetical protein EUTSA_v10026834mg [Eutrema salsugineum]|uniref:F-box domain-containing protein n=1 Tax=Eutrema salsugineum TaxID=72664 RepID=V4MG87_EUTSA|nr:hypothetical protein EUTSA_v10026834mg [Eutrema salsugineum]
MTVPQPPSSSFSSLPDEITENILARVSRWNYPWLSLVSKRFRSLLSSKELYKTRSQIGANEIYIYVDQFSNDKFDPRWFSLWPNRDQTKRGRKIKFKQNSSGNLVVPIPCSCSSSSSSSFHSPHIQRDSMVAVGSEIYLIGGSYNRQPTSSIRIFDCRSHTWRDAPNMTVPRRDAAAVFLDEKIYVIGGGCDKNSANGFEVFDIKTQSWTALRIPDDEVRNELYVYSRAIVVQGKLYVMAGTRDYTYEPKEAKWEVAREESSIDSVDDSWCVIENVMYCVDNQGYCRWYDSEDRVWKVIKGLEQLREHRTRGLRACSSETEIANYGGKLLISLETRCNGREVWGEVEWVDALLTIPRNNYGFLRCFTVSV